MGRKNESGLQRGSLDNEAALGAERLANLLTLSYEPMLAWRLDGPIEFWNAGAERLYGFTPNEAVGRSSHALLQTKFPVDFAELRSQLRSRGWGSCATSAKMVARSSSRAICSCSVTTPCWKPIAILLRG